MIPYAFDNVESHRKRTLLGFSFLVYLPLYLYVAGFNLLDALPAATEAESTRSAPPDTTPYTRPAVPEDYAPFGKPALGPRVRKGPTLPRGFPREPQAPTSSRGPKPTEGITD